MSAWIPEGAETVIDLMNFKCKLVNFKTKFNRFI